LSKSYITLKYFIRDRAVIGSTDQISRESRVPNWVKMDHPMNALAHTIWRWIKCIHDTMSYKVQQVVQSTKYNMVYTWWPTVSEICGVLFCYVVRVIYSF